MSNAINTPAATPATPATPQLLAVLHAAWEADGKKAPNAKEAQTLVKAWEAASVARDKAEKVFTDAQKAESQACAAIVRARGKGRIKIGDATYIPMSRGETCYFRKEGGEPIPAFG